MERWRPVINVRGKVVEGYEISNRGRVRTFIKQGHAERTARPRMKATFPDRADFMNVTLRSGPGTCFVYLVHHLVAIAFVGPRPSRKHVVVHINHDRGDNRARNLRWMTRSEASHHSMKHRPRRGIHAKFTPAKVRTIRRSKLTVRQLAEKYDVTVQTIYGIIKRKTWRDVE